MRQVRLRALLVLAALAVALLAPGASTAGFAPGQCTTWAFLMRPEIVADSVLDGLHVQDWNAWRWAANARQAGFPVGTAPKVGAIAVWPPHVQGAGPVGHVAYVQHVRADGSFYVSEADYNGNPNVTHRWVKPSHALQFVYLRPGTHAPKGPITPGGQIEQLSSSGTYAGSDPGRTTVAISVNAGANVSFRFTGPGVNRTFGWHIPAGTHTVGLDRIAGASTLPAGSYKLTAFAYNTQIAWRWLSFRLG